MEHTEDKDSICSNGMENEDTILIAIEDNDISKVKHLLDTGANVDSRDGNDFTPLFSAAREGRLEIVQLLLDRGASVDLAATSRKASPLNVAAHCGHFGVVKLLLDSGANIDLGSGGHQTPGTTPLIGAAQEGHYEVVELLVIRGATIDLASEQGSTPLTIATQNGFCRIVSFLLDNGANINHMTAKESTPIFLAASYNHPTLVRLLLDRGARTTINQAMNEGYTPLSIAVRYERIEIVEMLLNEGASMDLDTRNPLTIASELGNMAIVKLLLDKGANVNWITKSTPLIMATLERHTDIVKLLLQYGADVNLTVPGFSPLYLAAFDSQTGIEITKLLLERGADVNWGTSQGLTALHAASKRGNLEIMQLLLDSGANVTLKHNKLISTAALAHKFDAVKLLLTKGVQLSEKKRQLALRESAKEGRLDICESLIRIRPKGVVESEIVHLVAQCSDSKAAEIMAFLIDNGANVNSKVKEHVTLHYAVINRNVPLVWLLVLHGADTSIPLVTHQKTETVWQMCEGDKAIHEALLHFWSPQTHKYHPQWVRTAIIRALLIAKKKRWPFDQPVVLKILSYIAYGWYTEKLKISRPRKAKKTTETSKQSLSQVFSGIIDGTNCSFGSGKRNRQPKK